MSRFYDYNKFKKFIYNAHETSVITHNGDQFGVWSFFFDSKDILSFEHIVLLFSEIVK